MEKSNQVKKDKRKLYLRYKGTFDHPYNKNEDHQIKSNYLFSAVIRCEDFALRDIFYPNVFKYWHDMEFEVFSKNFDNKIMNLFGFFRD